MELLEYVKRPYLVRIRWFKVVQDMPTASHVAWYSGISDIVQSGLQSRDGGYFARTSINVTLKPFEDQARKNTFAVETSFGHESASIPCDDSALPSPIRLRACFPTEDQNEEETIRLDSPYHLKWRRKGSRVQTSHSMLANAMANLSSSRHPTSDPIVNWNTIDWCVRYTDTWNSESYCNQGSSFLIVLSLPGHSL